MQVCQLCEPSSEDFGDLVNWENRPLDLPATSKAGKAFSGSRGRSDLNCGIARGRQGAGQLAGPFRRCGHQNRPRGDRAQGIEAKLPAQDDSFRRHVFQVFGERLSALMQVVEAIAYQKLDQRLAALLVNRSLDGEIHATHQALADDLGSVREIVSRLLRNFEDRGWVDLGRERVRVVDRGALASLARG